MFKKISYIVIPIFYIAAGGNHFWHPEAYYKIIPGYLPYPVIINILAAMAEIILGVLFIFRCTRKVAAYGIIAMLIAFIPAHIEMIQHGSRLSNSYHLPLWILWIRLFPLQFLLIYWVWICRK